MAKAAKTGMFVKPTIEELVEFIDQKMRDWPRKFCEYSANKFFNHYQARGWALSKNVIMKDWRAAFCANWMTLKFDEDKKFLEQCLREPAHRIAQDQRRRESAGMYAEQEAGTNVDPLDRTLDYLDETMKAYRSGTVTIAQLRSAADWLRPRNLLRLKRDQIDQIKILSGNDGDLARDLAVKQFFDNLAASGLTVKSYCKSKMEKV